MVPNHYRWVSSGGQFTTRRIPTSSKNRLGGAISSRMTVLLLLPVFLLLSCVIFLTSLVVWAASTRIALGTVCSRPLQEISTRSILYPCSLPLGLHISGSLSHVPLHNCLPMARSALSQPTSSTAGTLAQRLVLGWFPRCWGKPDFCLNLFWAPSHALYLALLSALVLSVSCSFTLSHKLNLSWLLVCWSFPSPFQLHHTHQLAPAGLCHVYIYIYPESMLHGTLIECAPLSLSCQTACSFFD